MNSEACERYVIEANCVRVCACACEPVGPLRLSVQPGIGSFMAAVTMVGRTMATGI